MASPLFAGMGPKARLAAKGDLGARAPDPGGLGGWKLPRRSRCYKHCASRIETKMKNAPLNKSS